MNAIGADRLRQPVAFIRRRDQQPHTARARDPAQALRQRGARCGVFTVVTQDNRGSARQPGGGGAGIGQALLVGHQNERGKTQHSAAKTARGA